MAITVTQPDVTTAATLIASVPAQPSDNEGDYRERSFLIKNLTGGDVFVGDSGVTTGTGFKWAATDPPLSLRLEPGESLYGIVASGHQQLHVIRTGR